MREVEIRVRDLAGASPGDLGVALMKESLQGGRPAGGPVLGGGRATGDDGAFFWGAIGVFKNPGSHRQVEYDDPTTASEVVLLADLLLRLLDGAANRRGLPGP